MCSSDKISVRKIKKKSDVDKFIKLPFKLYRKTTNWVAPLISEQRKFFNPSKNPYYDHSEVQLFLAEKDGEVVGRITAHTNKQHNLFHDDQVGFFGFFEAVNEEEVAQKLFAEATKWLRKRHCTSIRGPLNLSVNDECGLLVEGFTTPPFIMMPYNHEYYDNLITKAGLEKCKDLYAYLLTGDSVPSRLERVAKIIEKRSEVRIETLSNNKKKLRNDIETIFRIYRKAWEYNWGVVPMTTKEYQHTVDTIMGVVDPDLVLIAYVNHEPVGFSVALPDYNYILKKMRGHVLPFGFLIALYHKNRIKRLRVMLMGILKGYQKRGIDALFYYYTFKNGLSKGFNEAEFSWILEDNVEMNNVAKKLGAQIHKTYRIYEKQI